MKVTWTRDVVHQSLLLLVAVGGIAACSIGHAAEKAHISDSDRLLALVVSFLHDASSSREELLSCNIDGIVAIEDFLGSRSRADTNAIPSLVAKLGHEKHEVRREATEKLSLFPQSTLPLIAGPAKTATDPEVRMRLKEVVASINIIDRRTSSLLLLLNEMYNTHAVHIIKQRLPLLAETPNSTRAVYALNSLDFTRAWTILESATNDEKLTYLLLKVYTADSQKARAKLKAFSAKDVLRVAAATWWPIEIEPIAKDGAYGWTTRACAIEGNTARNVIRLSVKMPDFGNVAERGEWVHLNQWSEVTYVFRFPAYCSKNTLGFARPASMPDEVLKWKPTPLGTPPEVPGRCDTFRGFPATARLPMAHISGKESLDWHLGKNYEWAKPLFPEDLAKEVPFIKNKYKEPQITKPNQELKATGEPAP